jgi:protein-disulfide isomerase
LLSALMLAACGPSEPPAAAPLLPTATLAVPTATAAAVPTVTPAAAALAPTAVPETAADWTQTVTVEGDYYVLGNPDAPVRITDYSDFL